MLPRDEREERDIKNYYREMDNRDNQLSTRQHHKLNKKRFCNINISKIIINTEKLEQRKNNKIINKLNKQHTTIKDITIK